ncbi:VWA domain-containing protein [Mitsuaria sp. GD03876]|uniref:vWA domain-containing protein n=1 Tax=Mitsuaria sp. GD03876 TaxID=2975399 RepID=UPI0024474301|nr:VWA domain-containing protein [Mitsuaria sp. GD03876]MDH0866490.1 VWA domain-containing protein [Mitsuaria sp. GD03876]
MRWAAAALSSTLLLAGCGRRDEASSAPPAAPASLAFTVLAGSEVKDLEPAIVAAGKAAGVEVKMSYAGTLDIVERINAGEAFDAILPPNGAYPSLALAKPPLAREKLFYSRIALGVKAAKLADLGWDRRAPTWADIAKAASGGKLHYAMTNAASSNSGMSALFAVAAASSGKTEDMAASDVDEKVITAFLSGQRLTAGSSGWLADAFAQDPGPIDAMVNYEAVILRANEKLPPAQRLTLVYPRDGMISADYPLMLLNEARREPYNKLVAALKAVEFQRDALGPAFLRPANPQVAAAAALPTAAIAELSFPNKLEVIDAVLSAYQAKWRKPSTSIFVLDISGSMKGERIELMREALKVLGGAAQTTASARLAAFQGRERVILIPFDDRVDEPILVPFDAGDIAGARARLAGVADELRPRGGTAVYSALAAALEVAAQERREHPERFVSVALLTDGESNKGLSFAAFKQRYGQGAPARVFPILFGEGNVDEMKQIAQMTGGREFDGRRSRLAQVFREIRGYQ